MFPRNPLYLAAMTVLAGLAAWGCERDPTGLDLAPGDPDPIVFDDQYGNGVIYQAFWTSLGTAVSVDESDSHEGPASLKIVVPRSGWSGGAFTAGRLRDLSRYNALTFWAKASRPDTLNEAGIGNDNTGTSRFTAVWAAVPITTTWTKYVLPIPLPAKLANERGLFFFSEAAERGVGNEMWFDEVMFEQVDGISDPRPAMAAPSRPEALFVGATVEMKQTRTTFAVDGVDRTIAHLPGYFTYFSSNDSVATVEDGVVRVVGVGTARITAKLDTVNVVGAVTLKTVAPPPVAAPRPTLPASSVISLFSNAYTNVRVDTWSASWDKADSVDLEVSGDDVKGYTNLNYAGIEFTSHPINAAAMTHLHLDVWIPTGTLFKVKLVDFGPDGKYTDGTVPDDITQHEIPFTPTSTPPLIAGEWVGLDIPLENFTGLASREHLAQLILIGNATTRTVCVDNVYFHK